MKGVSQEQMIKNILWVWRKNFRFFKTKAEAHGALGCFDFIDNDPKNKYQPQYNQDRAVEFRLRQCGYL